MPGSDSPTPPYAENPSPESQPVPLPARLAVLFRAVGDLSRARRAGDPVMIDRAERDMAAAKEGARDLLLPYADVSGWRQRYGDLLDPEFAACFGAGWSRIAEEALDRLVIEEVVVHGIRESKAFLQILYRPRTCWRSREHLRRVGAICDRAAEASRVTCDACEEPGVLRLHGRGAVRCERHRDLLA